MLTRRLVGTSLSQLLSPPLRLMQVPTCRNLRIRSPSDARTIFHAVSLNILPMITRRLDARDRNTIANGSIYVWEERSHKNDLTTVGMERWTDGIRWGPTRVRREGFLFYHQNQEYLSPPYVNESQSGGSHSSSSSRDPSRLLLVKQTFTVTAETAYGRRKWHLIAYFIPDRVEELDTIDDRPYLSSLVVPHELYKSATRGGVDDNSESSDAEKSSPRQTPYSFPMQPPPQYDRSFSRKRDTVSHSSPRFSQHSPPSRSASPYINATASHTLSRVAHRAYPSHNSPDHRYRSELRSDGPKLAPLSMLNNLSAAPRHPMDQQMLNSFQYVRS